MKFEIDTKSPIVVDFLKMCYDNDLNAQMADVKFYTRPEVAIFHEIGEPYHGASGGAVKFVFRPTSIGVITHVEFNGTHYSDILDITEYENW